MNQRQKRKRRATEEIPTETPTEDEETVVTAAVSPVRERESEAIVKRATRGLMRLESRRRFRSFLRKICLLLVLAGALWGLGILLADYVPTEFLRECWEEVQYKLLLPFTPEAELTPEVQP